MSNSTQPTGSLAARLFTRALLALALAGLAGCANPTSKTPTTSVHTGDWMNGASSGFHGAVVKADGLDYTKAKWSGMACNACHAGTNATQTSPNSRAPNCFVCHAGGPDGSPGHPSGWGDLTSASFHGPVVKAAGYDFKKALAGTLACSVCHAGDNAGQSSPNSRAPNCFACHAGGPDGTAGHPPGWLDVASPNFHGGVVVAAGFDYTKAIVGGLPCSACHAGISPSQPSYNSRAPNCFVCHAGGPDGSAGHPASWLGQANPVDCLSCHTGQPGGPPGPAPKPSPSATPSVAATMSLEATRYEGLSVPVRVTVTDRGAVHAAGTIAVQVTSIADPTGETLSLVETASGSGTFSGTILLKRLFEESGTAAALAADGKVAVYAEGGVATDSITVTYGALSMAAAYVEPASTVTGIIRVNSAPTGGASVWLAGNGGFQRATVSRSDGAYAFHEVPSGTYYLTAAVNGAVQATSIVVVP